ncbi:MAG: DNA recombination protein RmuC [Gammaproteobacteria bacterium]|nr:MAG: DNA recombination protein RmuC [Gammaproteobacteria bacterium]RLA20973.1 MAG: DNA recombination protein RmuC [Gammaproteobacteria bacterium]
MQIVELDLVSAIAYLLPAIIIGAWAVYLWLNPKITHLKEENNRLAVNLELELHYAEEQRLSFEAIKEQSKLSFSELSQQALRKTNEDFLQLAQENFNRHQVTAEAALSQKEQAFNTLLTPIRETLKKTTDELQGIEKNRIEAYGSISQYLENMTLSQQQLQLETRHLVQALRRPEIRGQWGELTLKRLVELAGMADQCDFYEQEQQSGEEGPIRPDMIIRLADNREIIVDAKTPLDAYLTATETADETLQNKELERHARQVRERIRELSGKKYWAQFKNSPDFVVLFIPGDQFLSAALEKDPGLLEDALRKKIILATPTSLIALLRTVAYGWRQLALAENAENIRDLGETLYKRLATFTEHLSKLGGSLDKSVEFFNKSVGSLERQVLPSVRRFEEMGIQAEKEIEQLEPIDRIARDLTKQPESEPKKEN